MPDRYLRGLSALKQPFRFLSFLFVFLLSIATGAKESSLMKDDFIWLEYGEGTREKDGSLVLELKVNYGRFPDIKYNSVVLDNINAVYTCGSISIEKENKFYRADTHKDVSGHVIKIKSTRETQYTLTVTADKTNNGITSYYLAKASFTLFGKSLTDVPEDLSPVNDSTGRLFEIVIDPEYHYWPQTGEPVKVSLVYNNEAQTLKGISIFDEHGSSEYLTTDESGSVMYTPPDDKILNSAGETASKQTVLVSSIPGVKTHYISSYTLLLHRSRFGKHQPAIGLAVFGGAFILFTVYMIVIRARSGF